MSTGASRSVLDGLEVLDLTRGMAGALTTMLLADNGARVTRVEAPGDDPLEAWAGARVWARGKRRTQFDLHDAQDLADVQALAARADVVVQTFRPGVAERYGLDHGTTAAANPATITCAITGYGRANRHEQRPAYDALVAARTGLQWENRSWMGGAIDHIHGIEPPAPDLELPAGMAPGAPRSGPIFTYTAWPSLCAAYLATTGISAALHVRLTTGRGQLVETSLLQAAMTLTMGKWQRVEKPLATGYRMWITDSRAPKGHFRCADDRWVHHWVPNPMFVLSSADGDHLASRRGITNVRNDPDRVGNDPENIVVLAHYYPEMAAATARFPSAAWEQVATEYGVPLRQVRSPEEGLGDRALFDEGVVVDLDDAELGPLRQVGIVYRLSETPGRVQGPAAAPGAHTAEVRAELGHDTAPRGRAVGAGASEAVSDAPAHPLAGVVVLDLGFAVAGPFGTQILADLGATVIKVNARRDPWWHCTHIAMGANRGKRSIGIDLKSKAGMATLHRLVHQADVVHMNIRASAALRLGVDEASMRAVNPDIIYCHTRGFEDGPRSNSPANDQTGNALAGTEYEDGGCADGGAPFWSLTSMGDTGNGFLSAIGVIQALYHRAKTGVAQRVDTSILNAAMLATSYAATTADGVGLPRPRLDAMQTGISAGYAIYATADAWLCLAVLTDEHWRRLYSVLPALGLDERFATAAGRAAADRALREGLATELATRPAAHWFAALDTVGVPCEISAERFAEEFFDDPAMRAAGRTVTYDHPELGRFEHSGLAIDFSETPAVVWGPPPLVGQHSRELLAEFGFATVEIDDLVAGDAVFENLSVV